MLQLSLKTQVQETGSEILISSELHPPRTSALDTQETDPHRVVVAPTMALELIQRVRPFRMSTAETIRVWIMDVRGQSGQKKTTSPTTGKDVQDTTYGVSYPRCRKNNSLGAANKRTRLD